MAKPLTWRTIEAALAKVSREYGFLLDRGESGDIHAMGAVIIDDTVDDLNLTELAKDLEKELA